MESILSGLQLHSIEVIIRWYVGNIGEPKGYDVSNAVKKPKSDVEIKYEQLQQQVVDITEENVALKSRVTALEKLLIQAGIEIPDDKDIKAIETSTTTGNSATMLRKSFNEAKLMDEIVNGE